MANINVLPGSISELIAAGEVIERPASIVKELVENSIDAGATTVTVEIQRGGISYLRVTDNGCGIAFEDAATAFLRHATSKVKSAADLDRIGTLGFRGEALASIAAVARVEMLTKTREAETGALVKIAASKVESVTEAGCPQGTTLVARDIFYNVPARLKFLKKDVSEGNAVESIVEKVALSHPEISFKFLRDNRTVFHTPGDGKLLNVVYTIFGREFSKTLMPVDYTLGGVRVSGYAGKPMASRANRSMQHFFVNGRYTKTKTAGVALEEAYRSSIMVGKFPSCVLQLTMPCDQVDVNVHPAKIEVRFVSEKSVFDAVYFAVKSAIAQDNLLSSGGKKDEEVKRPLGGVLSQFSQEEAEQQTLSAAASSAFRPENSSVIPSFTHGSPQQNLPSSFSGQEKAQPFSSAPSSPGQGSPQAILSSPSFSGQGGGSSSEENLPLDSENGRSEHPAPEEKSSPDGSASEAASYLPQTAPEGTANDLLNAPSHTFLHPDFAGDPAHLPSDNPYEGFREPSVSGGAAAYRCSPQSPEIEVFPRHRIRVIGELFYTYILAQIDETFAIIDKHAAHERILYNRLKERQDGLEKQYLLTSQVVTLSKAEHQCVLERQETLDQLGFTVEDFGGNAVVLRSVPAVSAGVSAVDMFLEIAASMVELRRKQLPDVVEDILHRIACRSAVKGGDLNRPEELQKVVETICSDENVRYCPHGRPVILQYTRSDLEKLFGRIQ